jgi:hypothetical protein
MGRHEKDEQPLTEWERLLLADNYVQDEVVQAIRQAMNAMDAGAAFGRGFLAGMEFGRRVQ